MMTGMPASIAVLTASRMASGSGADTAMPSTPSVTAASISCACSSGSLLDSEYLTVTPRSLPASSAPFLATAQNESAVAVRDDRDRDVLAPGSDRRCRLRRRSSSSPPPQPANTSTPADQHQEHQRKSPHDSATLSLRVGASECRYSMLVRTSVTGPLPTGGSSPVMAVSCSSTSQRSYPVVPASPRPRRCGRRPCRAGGTAPPASPRRATARRPAAGRRSRRPRP